MAKPELSAAIEAAKSEIIKCMVAARVCQALIILGAVIALAETIK